MDAPHAEFDADEALVRRLVSEQHPDLAGPVRLVANGWDNAVFRLGDDLAVRMPRRAIAVALIENEQRWLPGLAAAVSVPIPVAVRVGAPSETFPLPWSIVPWIAGTSVAELPVADRGALAAELAAFVVELGRPAPADAPHNPVRAVPLAERDAVVSERLAGLEHGADLAVLWRDAVAAPAWAGPPLWVHGDLHPANLVTAGGGLTAVVDFGDLSAGDPATDLAAAWMVFDADGRREFRRAIGDHADEAAWRRARGWAVSMASSIIATTSGDGPIARIGAHALAQLLPGAQDARSAGAS
ncbi:aminoglycoside phosphotransferase family protein [Agromyces atrinae]|uniref:aminoglycoside phosphotransferase family protein n=1 Tax=Agromyces atrinae TaxID=592376 RepID=UPI001F5897FF|nr:aminoglycoside phosphotransferase family protein [Agromyces atrinae]MCI2956783.1 aminoglycoside phosphotransferase family protein [Agromyces atrinae]